MIKYHNGDITTVESGIIVHQVNCQGVMGSGVAKAIRNKYPFVYESYNYMCKSYSEEYLLGKANIVPVSNDLEVINLFGQLNYGKDGKRYTSYDALDNAFNEISNVYHGDIFDFHFPLIGCGLGGGNWNIVYNIILEHLNKHNIHIWSL